MAHKVKRLAVLGSTGFIGRRTLENVRALPERFSVASHPGMDKVVAAVGKLRDILRMPEKPGNQ